VWQGSRLVGVTAKHALAAAGAVQAGAAGPGPVAAGGSGPPQTAKWSERIALSGFAPGVYELRVLVDGKDGRPAAQRRVAFRVE
jgi:hypothetical protein